MSEAKKINHALEHGTIYFIRKKFGNNIKVGGCAEEAGFRICGISEKKEIINAFETFIKNDNKENIIILMRCGSNIVTAQGFGLILLTVSAVFLKITHANHVIISVILLLNVLIYYLLRKNIAEMVQEKLFMSLNFKTARIHSINKVKKKRYTEINPVYMVKTIVDS
ncbi:MAG: hypothetical protein GY795_03090 [Desulfobacterales bacterium]|nr:hypothetical protein [Desulfobacterales bacterium]